MSLAAVSSVVANSTAVLPAKAGNQWGSAELTAVGAALGSRLRGNDTVAVGGFPS
jgi:hypothetical protein